MAQMDKVTQRNAAAANETASASGNLADEVDGLRDDISSLQTIVYGKGGGNGGGNGGNGKRFDSATNHKQLAAPGAQKVMRPDMVLEMDDV
jgi:hypothetical protein